MDDKFIDEHNWKLYEASQNLIDGYNQTQAEQDSKLDKWIMTMAAGSFGLSFAFIEKIVDIKTASDIGILIAGWSCFLAVLIVGLVGFMVSSFVHSLLAKEEAEVLALRYKGIEPRYKKRNMFFGGNAILGYFQILLFIGGSICLFLFIGKNLL